MKHYKNKKWFALLMNVNNKLYLNVKTDPNYSDIMMRNCMMQLFLLLKIQEIFSLINKIFNKEETKLLEANTQNYNSDKKSKFIQSLKIVKIKKVKRLELWCVMEMD